MTAAQQARTVGFRASLAVRGVTLLLADASPSFSAKALIERMPPVLPEYGKQIQHADVVRLHFLRSDIGSRLIPTGSTFLSDESRFRVTSVEDNGISVAVVFSCRESKAA